MIDRHTSRNVQGASAQSGADPLARLTGEEITQLERAQRAARVIGLIVPLILTLIATALTLAWVPLMPDPMAMHWNGAFQVDGYGPPWSNAALSLGVGALITSLYALQHLPKKQTNAALWGPMYRFTPAIILGTIVGLQTIVVGTAWIQIGLSDARDARGAGWVILAGFAAWILVTLAAYFMQPRLTITAPASTEATPLPLSASQRAVWFGTSSAPKGVIGALATGVGVLLAGAVVLSAVGGEPLGAWIMVGLTLLVLALAATNTWFRVRVDHTGLEARSVLGWPVYRVAADDVKRVAAVQINPFAEYGGWGVRLAPTGFGIVLRTGEGVLIHRHSRARTFAITVDHAAEAAALLATVAPRLEQPSAKGDSPVPH